MENQNQNNPLVHLVSCDELTGDAKSIFENIEKNSGKVPKWMKVMGNSEDIFVSFFKLFNSTMCGGKVDALMKWKVAYKVSELNKCEFCVSVSKMKLSSFGLSEDEISKIDVVKNDVEKLVLEYAEESTKHAYKIDSEIKGELKKHFSDEEIVELTATVGLFNFINRFNDALDVLPD